MAQLDRFQVTNNLTKIILLHTLVVSQFYVLFWSELKIHTATINARNELYACRSSQHITVEQPLWPLEQREPGFFSSW